MKGPFTNDDDEKTILYLKYNTEQRARKRPNPLGGFEAGYIFNIRTEDEVHDLNLYVLFWYFRMRNAILAP